MSIFFGFVTFLIGFSIGSFLNVLIDRLPRGESILGRSHCELCKKTLLWKDLIPVLSFVYLRGRCRYCRAKLSFQYPLVEFLTGVLFVSTFILISSGTIFNEIINHKSLIINLVYYLTIVSSLIVIFFSDLKYGIIPDKIIFPAVLVSLAYLFINHNSLVLNHLLSAFGAFLFFLLIYLITRGRGMGLGDVKLSFLIGLILGFPGTVFSLYIAFLTGGLVGIILILWKKKKLKYAVPFGPFLVIGCGISLLFQDQIIQKLLGLF